MNARIRRSGIKSRALGLLSVCALIFSMVVVLPQTFLTSANAVDYQSDTALDFNGTSQYGAAGNSTALRTFNAISIEAWVMPQASCTGNIIAKANDYALYCNLGELNYALGGAGSWVGVSTSIVLPANEWHHIALTRAASTNVVNIYFDGALLYTGTADNAGTGSIKNSTGTFLNIGARAQAATFFNGLVDEVRIFNAVRSEAQVVSDMHTWGNLGLASVVGYFDFNDISGSTVSNKAVNPDANSDLTLTGSPTAVSVETTVISGNARIVTFPRTYLNSDGGWALTPGVFSFRALVIGGGGGGGNDEGGGGGAGGFIESTTVAWDYSNLISIKVGQGGHGSIGNTSNNATSTTLPGENGQNSQLLNIVAVGGGGGGSSNNVNNDPDRAGRDGGSGGGGAGESYSGRSPGSGTAGQGFSGGSGVSSGSGGGGGGAGEAGSTDGNGAGGDGKTSTITGISVTYAGGGGGGFGNTTGGVAVAGGLGGGGTGGDINSANTAGTANTGGGGGGGCGNVACGPAGVTYSGASGGSGVIIIRFLIDSTAPTFSNSSTLSINENISINSLVLTVQVSESSTISLSGGTDVALFTLTTQDSDTSLLRLNISPDYESPQDVGANNVYNITISAVDVASNSASQNVAVTVLNLNESSKISEATLSATPYKGIPVTISAQTNVAGRANFLINGKRIPNCQSRPTSGSYPIFTITCSWKPALNNFQNLQIEFNPSDSTFSSVKSTESRIFVAKRSTRR